MNLICGCKKSDYRSLSVIASVTSDLINNCFTFTDVLIKDHCKKIDLKGLNSFCLIYESIQICFFSDQKWHQCFALTDQCAQYRYWYIKSELVSGGKIFSTVIDRFVCVYYFLWLLPWYQFCDSFFCNLPVKSLSRLSLERDFLQIIPNLTCAFQNKILFSIE